MRRCVTLNTERNMCKNCPTGTSHQHVIPVALSLLLEERTKTTFAGGVAIQRPVSRVVDTGTVLGKVHNALPELNTRDTLKRKAQMRVDARIPGMPPAKVTKVARDMGKSLLGRIQEQVVGAGRAIVPMPKDATPEQIRKVELQNLGTAMDHSLAGSTTEIRACQCKTVESYLRSPHWGGGVHSLECYWAYVDGRRMRIEPAYVTRNEVTKYTGTVRAGVQGVPQGTACVYEAPPEESLLGYFRALTEPALAHRFPKGGVPYEGRGTMCHGVSYKDELPTYDALRQTKVAINAAIESHGVASPVRKTSFREVYNQIVKPRIGMQAQHAAKSVYGMVNDLLDTLDASQFYDLQRLVIFLLSLKLGLRDGETCHLDWNEIIRYKDRRFGVHFSLDKSVQDKGVWKILSHESHCELYGDSSSHAWYKERHGRGRGSEHCLACLVEEFRQRAENRERVLAGKYVFVSEKWHVRTGDVVDYPLETGEQCFMLRDCADRVMQTRRPEERIPVQKFKQHSWRHAAADYCIMLQCGMFPSLSDFAICDHLRWKSARMYYYYKEKSGHSVAESALPFMLSAGSDLLQQVLVSAGLLSRDVYRKLVASGVQGDRLLHVTDADLDVGLDQSERAAVLREARKLAPVHQRKATVVAACDTIDVAAGATGVQAADVAAGASAVHAHVQPASMDASMFASALEKLPAAAWDAYVTQLILENQHPIADADRADPRAWARRMFVNSCAVMCSGQPVDVDSVHD